MGELDMEPESGTRRGCESGRRATCAPGRRDASAGAVAPDGTLVGLTEVIVNEHAPRAASRAARWSTPTTAATAWAWRSSSPTTARLREHFPQCRVLLTGNADVNAADERRQRRARLPRGRALRRDAAGRLTDAETGCRTGHLPRLADGDPTARRARPGRDGRLARDATTRPTCSGWTTRRRGCWRRCAPSSSATGPGSATEPFGGYVDGRLRGHRGPRAAACWTTCTLARVDVATHPADRRRGHGAAMLEHLTAVAVGHGRSTAERRGGLDLRRPPGRRGHPERRLPDPARLRALPRRREAAPATCPSTTTCSTRLAAEAATATRGYRCAHFVGPVPEDLLDGFGALVGSLITEAPMGDLDFEPEVFDAARIRADEKVFEASGRTKYTTVAIAPDGELVAYSELVVPSYDPGRVYQWGTLVPPEHRGHRLGLATKVHNLRRFQERESGRTALFTYNAEVNRPHDRGERGDGLPARAAPRRVPEAALEEPSRGWPSLSRPHHVISASSVIRRGARAAGLGAGAGSR